MILGRIGAIAAKDLADGAPFSAAEFPIVMPAVNILRDEIAHDAADEDVGGKMLAATNTRVVHERGEAVNRNFHERVGIFVRDDAGDRPRGGSVLRGKGSATVKEGSSSVTVKRTLTP